jgi:hypothetical protein
MHSIGSTLTLSCSTVYSSCVSVPPDFGGLSVDAYLSGIVAGILEGAGFHARVTAHSVALEEGEAAPISSTGAPSLKREKAVFLVKFAASVLERDATASS